MGLEFWTSGKQYKKNIWIFGGAVDNLFYSFLHNLFLSLALKIEISKIKWLHNRKRKTAGYVNVVRKNERNRLENHEETKIGLRINISFEVKIITTKEQSNLLISKLYAILLFCKK